MKIYFINDNQKRLGILNKLIKCEFVPIIEKNEYNFRATKNDFVIVSDFEIQNPNNESLKKYNNLIVLTESKTEETISVLADEYNTKDVIYSLLDEDYIVQRIIKYISKNME